MNIRAFFILLIILLTTTPAATQTFSIHLRQITSENGLSDNEVTSVIQDKQGYLWIGTKSGLNRYDSRDFYLFRHKENDSTSICGDHITCLEIDDDSLLWIGTATSGLSCYNFRTGKFRNYNAGNSSLPNNNIVDLAFDPAKKTLYIGCNTATTCMFNTSTGKITLFPSVGGWKNRTAWDIEVYGKNTYLALQSMPLGKLQNGELITRHVPPRHKTVNSICATGDTIVYAGIWNNALYEYDQDVNFKEAYIFDGSDSISSSSDEIICLEHDNQHRLWCGTKYSGLYLFDLHTKSFLKNINLEPVIQSKINKLYCDKSNRVWIATNSGLFVYDPLFNQFSKNLLPVPEGVVPGKVIDRLFTPGGKEFVIAEGAIYYKMKPSDPYSCKPVAINGNKQKLFSTLQTRSKKIYIGSNKSVHQLDTGTATILPLKVCGKDPGNIFFNLPSSRITSMTEWIIGSDTLLAAAAYGYYIYLIDFKKRNIYALNPINKNGIGSSEHLVRKIFISSSNELWKCGANKGLEKLTLAPDAAIWHTNYRDTIFQEKFSIKQLFLNDPTPGITDVTDILETAAGVLWFTTQGAGVIRFNPIKEPAETVRKGIGNAYWGCIQPDAENLWLSSSKGIYHYSISNDQLQLYDPSYGIPGDLSTYFFSTSDTTTGIGFNGGYLTFQPQHVLLNTEKPQVHISRIWVMDQPADTLLFKSIQLDYRQNFIKFNVATNSFSDNEETKIYYRLEGLDDKWYSNGTNTLLVYTNLKHGEYTLQVKAININGTESNIKSLHFSIVPPFYQTIWFQLLVLSGICTIIYLLYRFRIRQVMKLQEVRNKIARDLHDDIGSTLGSIHLYSQIANRKLQSNPDPAIAGILEKIESSSEEIIEKTADTVWVAKASNDTVNSLLLRMESYAASLLGAAGIHFRFHSSEKLVDYKLTMSQRKNIFLIYKEAIHNIIKHSGCSEVNITIEKRGHQLCITIHDDGRGISGVRDHFQQGNGLKNMQSRAEEMNGTFKLDGATGPGTTIEIQW